MSRNTTRVFWQIIAKMPVASSELLFNVGFHISAVICFLRSFIAMAIQFQTPILHYNSKNGLLQNSFTVTCNRVMFFTESNRTVSKRKIINISLFENNYGHIPFNSDVLCVRLQMVNVSRSLIFGERSFPMFDDAVEEFKLRFVVRCCLRFVCCPGTSFADRNATAKANRLSFVSF